METSESENFGSWIEMSEIKVMAVGYKATKKKKRFLRWDGDVRKQRIRQWDGEDRK